MKNNIPVLEIGGRNFRDIDSYNLAKKDYQNIEQIKMTLDMTNISSVKSMLKRIYDKDIVFYSLLGSDFTEELEELVNELENQEKDLKSKEKNKNKKSLLRNNEQIKNVSIRHDEELLQREIQNHLKHKERKRKVYISILALILFISVSYLIFYFYMYAKNDSQYTELSELVKEDKTEEKYSVNIVQTDNSIPPVLSKYETLYQKNQKIVGWLKVEGTKIDYPVMQTVNNEYYLDHNYNQEYDKNGSIFLDKDCDAAHPNDNMIIYGHHMKSGKMFGTLNYYASEDFYKEHPTIMFDTIYEEGEYDVMYVFRSKIYSEEEIVFKYYKFIDATSENEFESNMNEMEQLSLYDTGIKAKYGDKLITLSTCDSSETNGRFVVVAKKKK